METKNLKEFKALKKRYETITIEEITKGFTRYTSILVAGKLTGFGSHITCTLCLAIKKDEEIDCQKCVYDTPSHCLKGKNKKTYDRIDHANTPLKLRNAFRARAKHMRTLMS